MYNIIDNFLPEYQFKQVQSTLLSSDFPWFWNQGICDSEDPFFQFYHCFYHIDRGYSEYGSLLSYIESKLNYKKLYRIKSNITTRTLFHRKTGYHNDYDDMTTSVFYINTTNGWTQFKNGDKVKSVSNRIVIFDSNLEHSGNACTDQKTRILINFNYER